MARFNFRSNSSIAILSTLIALKGKNMPKPLSARTIELVKQSAPAVAVHASDITKTMYGLLFKDEHIKALFNQANHGENGSQVHALAAAIVGYAQNIDNLAPLLPVIERIAHK